MNNTTDETSREQSAYEVKGTVRFADGFPARGVQVSAFDRDLRSEQLLGQHQTDGKGFYHIRYSARQFRKREKGSADLVVKVFAADTSLLAASPVLFNAPPSTELDVTIPPEVRQPPTLFEKIGRALEPLLERLKAEELEEDKEHQDLSFLSGESGFEKNILARFVLAHKLAQQAVQAEFWFALLGGSFFEYTDEQSLKEQLAAILDSLSSLDASAVRKALTRSFNQKEISDAFREKVADWIEAFLQFVARQSVSETTKPTFVKSALEHAGIRNAKKQETFARLFNEHKALTPELLDALEKDRSFKKEEIADLRTSFQLAELTRGDFSVVNPRKAEPLGGFRRMGTMKWVPPNGNGPRRRMISLGRMRRLRRWMTGVSAPCLADRLSASGLADHLRASLLADRLSASHLADHPSGIRPTMGMEVYAGLSEVSVPGGTCFFTVNLLERRLDTLVRHIDALREAVRVTRRERPFHIDAWVVLPNQLHCI